MEITYIGHSCFKIKGKDVSIVIDPYNPEKTGYKLPSLNAELLLVSHDHDDHNYIDGVSDYKLLVNGPGEYEIQEVFVYGLPTFHDANDGAERGNNTMYLIDIDGFTILHCGDLGHELKAETMENLSDIDVLLIPVGGTYTIDPKTATKVISSLEPKIVVPMHYQTKNLTGLSKDLAKLDTFLDEMGEEENGKVDKLKLSRKSDLPEETEVIVVTPTNG